MKERKEKLGDHAKVSATILQAHLSWAEQKWGQAAASCLAPVLDGPAPGPHRPDPPARPGEHRPRDRLRRRRRTGSDLRGAGPPLGAAESGRRLQVLRARDPPPLLRADELPAPDLPELRALQLREAG